jgi:hypothetical protein
LGAGSIAGAGATSRAGTKSTGSTASLATIRIPLAPPLDSGLTPSACHWRCSSLESSMGRGRLAQATPLHSSAKMPALFQPRGGSVGAGPLRRPNVCVWPVFINTGSGMAKQG